ncbi:TonB family protein [Arachidicoccus soli]|uniref:TonB family protein n=1 Tax=Arachidicoccus soli TaxID=2341117 RepID=A0A386HLX3_9BACT|nr:TonB family protein [Arachidicoccus soli]
MDSSGIALNGKKDGAWEYYTPISYKSRGEILTKDSVVKTIFYNLGKRISKEEYYGDTSENSAIKRKFFKTGDPITEEEFNKDTTGRRKAAYPKGPRGWQSYLTNNLNGQLSILVPNYKNLRDDRAPVTTSFIVGKDGSIDDVFIYHSAGYPFDNEAMRVIKNSGFWIPAQQHGHAVTYRQTQKIIFQAIRAHSDLD